MNNLDNHEKAALRAILRNVNPETAEKIREKYGVSIETIYLDFNEEQRLRLYYLISEWECDPILSINDAYTGIEPYEACEANYV